jgi:hypothetical protein
LSRLHLPWLSWLSRCGWSQWRLLTRLHKLRLSWLWYLPGLTDLWLSWLMLNRCLPLLWLSWLPSLRDNRLAGLWLSLLAYRWLSWLRLACLCGWCLCRSVRRGRASRSVL